MRENTALRDSVLMTAASIGAGGFDYLTNVLAGNLLEPVTFSLFLAVIALLQIVMHGTNALRNVVAFYAAQLTAEQRPTRPFFLTRWWSAVRWGVVAAVLTLLLSPLLQRLVEATTIMPLIAAALAVLLLFLRPVTDGMLQGVQDFVGLAGVTAAQAILRTLFTIGFIFIGLQATGALLALPLAAALAGVLAWWRLNRLRTGETTAVPVSTSYSLQTVIGLVAFALLVNIDAVLVRSFFDDALAGDYGAVITLRKINLFIPLALGMVLFPKAVARQQAGADPRPLLWLAMGLTVASGLAISAVFFLFPDLLTARLLGDAYQSLGTVLGWSGVATALFAAVNIWLNYALAQRQWGYIWSLAVIVVGMMIGLFVWHHSLLVVTGWLVAAGLLANIAGLVMTQNDKTAQ